MKSNTEKCYLMLSTRDSNKIETGNSLVKGSLSEKLLAVKFNHNLTFNKHVKSLCKKANAKLKALVGFVPYMGLVKKKLQMNSFFAAQLNYWPENMDDS